MAQFADMSKEALLLYIERNGRYPVRQSEIDYCIYQCETRRLLDMMEAHQKRMMELTADETFEARSQWVRERRKWQVCHLRLEKISAKYDEACGRGI